MGNYQDFSMVSFENLCRILISKCYSGISVQKFVLDCNRTPYVILRHDVDSWPANALQMAKIERSLGMTATYYFRRSPLSVNIKIIEQIVALGHEIGYHYEDLATHDGNFRKAYLHFQKNLDFFRRFYPVKTIAMHGRPLSQWDSKDLWNKYNYKSLGIICEPYLDIDFRDVMYLTDTGNCWDGDSYNIRDHVLSPFRFNIHSTKNLMEHIEMNMLPGKIMLNIHPARWNDNFCKWWIRYYILTVPKIRIKKFLKNKRGIVI